MKWRMACSVVQKTCSIPNASSNGESDHSFVPQLLYVTIKPHSVLFALIGSVLLQKTSFTIVFILIRCKQGRYNKIPWFLGGFCHIYATSSLKPRLLLYAAGSNAAPPFDSYIYEFLYCLFLCNTYTSWLTLGTRIYQPCFIATLSNVYSRETRNGAWLRQW